MGEELSNSYYNNSAVPNQLLSPIMETELNENKVVSDEGSSSKAIDSTSEATKDQYSTNTTDNTSPSAESPAPQQKKTETPTGDISLSKLDISSPGSAEKSAFDSVEKKEDLPPSDPVVVELRQVIAPELSNLLSDYDCLRFLRARNSNVAKAADMIAKWGLWWETQLPGTTDLPREVNNHPDEKEQVFTDLMPHSNLGETKSGLPIYWEKTGKISSIFHEVKKRMTEDEIFVRHIRQQEVMIRRLNNASMRHGRHIEKQVIVMDMKNVAMSLDFMALRVFKRTVVIDEACYPERLETLFMINAPFTFSVLWAMIKPWIDPVTVAKFKIIGSNYQEALKEYIAEEHIPVEYGGTCETFGWTYPNNIAPFDRTTLY